MNRILVTGSAGYIGVNLKTMLEQDGFATVVGFDVKHGQSVLDVGRLERSAVGIDAIIHLAAISSFAACDENPKLAFRTNVNGTVNVLYLAIREAVPLVMASTVAASQLTTNYGASKRVAERMVLAERHVVLRIANVYGGKDQLSDGVYARFRRAKQRGETVTIHGDGLQTRDFVHVYDVCTALKMAIAAGCGCYEVSSGIQTSILQVARLLGVPYQLAPDNDVGVTVPSHSDKWLPDWIPTYAPMEEPM
jgi:UDP-glucose 4-epimerase